MITQNLSTTARAQSAWQKIKRAALEQACRGGDQKACQDLSKQQSQQQGSPSPGQGQQRPGQQAQKPAQQPTDSQLNDSGPFKPPSGARIEETVLAPVQDRAKFEVSPHGVRVATVETEGSRAVVWYEGVEGPKFDEILNQNNSNIVFSPDGKRYAYCARLGSQMVVMVDGKELARTSESQGGNFNCQLGFTSNSKHIFYYTNASDSSIVNFSRFVWDGKPGPATEIVSDFRAFSFSPDGEHYAYVWSDPRRQKPWMLIVDGKSAPYQGGAPQWTSDSQHLYTQRSGAGTTELLYDGKPLARAFSFQVHIASTGEMVVLAVTGGSNGHPYSFLVLNGKKVPGSETVERGMIHDVIFSPDGKHYAANCEDLNVHHYLIVDGKRGQDYSAITNVTFTPDSSTLVYMAQANGKTFIVVGDKEYGGSNSGIIPPVLAPVGNRFAALMNNNGSGTSLLLDGKVAALNTRSAADLTFTPDGAHYAYLVDAFGGEGHLAIDGTVLPQSNLTKVDIMRPGDPQALHYAISADSKHFAHFAGDDRTGMRGVFLDGRFVPASREGVNTQLLFSPDSKHLFWIHSYGNQPHRLFVDGKPLVDFYSAGNMVSIPNWWEFNPDGTLSILVQDNNSLKRLTITLSPETSLGTFLGGKAAASMQAKQ